MRWFYGLSALAAAGLIAGAASSEDYAAMSTAELEDACAEAMAASREAGPYRDAVKNPGEEDNEDLDAEGMAACDAMQLRYAADER